MTFTIAALHGDVLVQILAQLNPAEILNFGLASKACRAAVDDISEQLWRLIALIHFSAYTPGTTCGADKPEPKTGLQRAISCRRTASNCYDGIQTWKDFVQLEQNLRTAWRHGTPKEKNIAQLDSSTHGMYGCSIYNFKVCPDTRLVIASLYHQSGPELQSMIVAIQMTSDARPSRAQVLTLIDKYSTRVQYANGLVVYLGRRSESSLSVIHVRKLRVKNDSDHDYFLDGHVCIQLPGLVNGYQTQYPFLAVGLWCEGSGQRERELRIYSLLDGSLQETYSVTSDQFSIQEARIEFNEKYVIWAQRCILAVERNTGAVLDLLPIGFNPSFGRFHALALSPDGNHLFAGVDGALIWYRQFRSRSSMNATDEFQSVMVLDIATNSDVVPRTIHVSDVAIQNEHVIFAVTSPTIMDGMPTQRLGYFTTVYAMRIFEWTGINDIQKHCPVLRSLAQTVHTPGKPSLVADSTAIYLSVRKPSIRRTHSLPTFTWSSPCGKICPAYVDITRDHNRQMDQLDNFCQADRDRRKAAPISHTVLAYEFANANWSSSRIAQREAERRRYRQDEPVVEIYD